MRESSLTCDKTTLAVVIRHNTYREINETKCAVVIGAESALQVYNINTIILQQKFAHGAEMELWLKEISNELELRDKTSC